MKFGTIIHYPEGLLDVVHVDVCGPSKVASLGGHKWFVSFVDGYSRRVWVATMTRRGEVLDIFKKWKKCVQEQSGRKIRELHGGKEEEDPFQMLCLKECIKRHFVSRETNGKQLDGGI